MLNSNRRESRDRCGCILDVDRCARHIFRCAIEEFEMKTAELVSRAKNLAAI